MTEEVRWKQRFENFEKAYKLFMQSLDDPAFPCFSVLERQGIIQQFEVLIELTWKTLKDLLEENGVEIKPVFPKSVMREAFSAGLLEDGELWASMLDKRNELSHEYSQTAFDKAIAIFQEEYKGAFKKLYGVLINEAAR